MPTVEPFPAGGYRFIVHQFQYSGGVAAEPGFRIERARFARPLPLAEGFDAIEAYLAGIGRSPTAFCACELRSPAQFTDAGFVAFNRHYVERLTAWGIFRDEVNPVARSNVCPEVDPPTTPSFYAFSYTVPSENRAARSFVAAGSGEAREERDEGRGVELTRLWPLSTIRIRPGRSNGQTAQIARKTLHLRICRIGLVVYRKRR